jgi:predicted RNA-binding Zn-ribbon protein involved in translation (DUF1610 family)
MQIDWQRAINDILASKLSCPRCGTLVDEVMIGYLRTTEAAQWAPLCDGCTKRDNCDARKFVLLCPPCATETRLRARPVNEQEFMLALMEECRRSLDESLDYIADYWREDLDIDPEEMDKRLHEVEPDLYEEENSWRRYVEEQYLKVHAWLRERRVAVLNPGWRSEYVEEVVAAGYTTLLGD